MCENHIVSEDILEKTIEVKDISNAVLEMPMPRGFVMSDDERGIKPRYAKEIKSLYLIMHWPIISEDESVVDEESGISESGMSMYAAVLPHGKTHVAEIFFVDEKSNSYRGTHKSFSIDFPENQYLEEYDDWLMDELAGKVLGVKNERALVHDVVI